MQIERNTKGELVFLCIRDAAYPFPTVGCLPVAFRAELKDNFFECKKKIASKNYSVSARRIFLKVAQIPQITRILIRQRIMACAVTYHLHSFSLEKRIGVISALDLWSLATEGTQEICAT